MLASPAKETRRGFLLKAAAAIATPAVDMGPAKTRRRSSPIKAVAFDAFAIFDPRPVFGLAEELFPDHAAELNREWVERQFDYTWLRNSMGRYTDFWTVTEDALNYAAAKTGVRLQPEQRRALMAAYLQLKPWPDVAAVIETLHKRGMRLALLTNWTVEMMQACLKGSGLEAAFQFQLSTDRVEAFKPDLASYRMGLEAFRLHKLEIAFVAFGAWDAAGARNFGYPTYWANRFAVPAEELGVFADASSHDLALLPAFLEAR